MKFILRCLIGLCLGLTLYFGFWFSSVEASPSLIDPRINRLESQLRSLQSQVTRLQSQLSRTSNSRSTAPDISAPTAEVPSFDQQFDTLAILIIELQQRVAALETTLDEMAETPPQVP